MADRGCNGHRPGDEGWGRGERPVINVGWNDAKRYLEWLSSKTGKSYRFASESEWEYAARAGTTTRYSWGDAIGRGNANCGKGCGDDYRYSAPVGSFAANDFGLHDMLGNVWEWVEDCRNGSYEGAPTDGSVWRSGDCESRILRGGSWNSDPRLARAAFRAGGLRPGASPSSASVWPGLSTDASAGKAPRYPAQPAASPPPPRCHRRTSTPLKVRAAA